MSRAPPSIPQRSAAISSCRPAGLSPRNQVPSPRAGTVSPLAKVMFRMGFPFRFLLAFRLFPACFAFAFPGPPPQVQAAGAFHSRVPRMPCPRQAVRWTRRPACANHTGLTYFNSHTSPWGEGICFQSCTSYVQHPQYIPKNLPSSLARRGADAAEWWGGTVNRGRYGARIGVAKPVLGVPFILTNAPGNVSDRPTVLVVTNMKP